MCQQSVTVNEYTFVPVLKACSNLRVLSVGQIIYCHIVDMGLWFDANIGSCLIHMYANCGTLVDAQRVFEKLPMGSSLLLIAMIDIYVEHDHIEEALELFETHYNHEIQPNVGLFVSILKGCSISGDLCRGRYIHAEIILNALESDTYVATSLIDHYIKCEQLEDAHDIYRSLSRKDVVTCSLMIAGFIQHGYPQESIQLLEQMQQLGLHPNHVTFASILQACANLGAWDLGHIMHANMIESGSQIDSYVISGLVDMYGKCGSLEDAHSVFCKPSNRNVVIWSSMMTSYLMHEDYMAALQCFVAMQNEGLKPDHVAFTSAISVCNQQGLVYEGCQHFERLEGYRYTWMLEHYANMIGLFGRAGCLVEAEAIIQSMPLLATIEGWLTLLGSCKMYGNNYLASKCLQNLMLSDPVLASQYLNILSYKAVDDLNDMPLSELSQ
ncbi:hypothetical protein KP509_20G008700 [Ceratopteris richardii]|nr:hypothetical protein KP509_20G008700 [Ceratopteris richardii]